jgi:hypothetical protein
MGLFFLGNNMNTETITNLYETQQIAVSAGLGNLLLPGGLIVAMAVGARLAIALLLYWHKHREQR